MKNEAAIIALMDEIRKAGAVREAAHARYNEATAVFDELRKKRIFLVQDALEEMFGKFWYQGIPPALLTKLEEE